MKLIRTHEYLLPILAAVFFSTLLLPSASYAQGNLLLTPKRLVFNGGRTSENINLANSGKDTAHYVISMINFRMTENGGFEEVSEAEMGGFSAEPHIRFFPRQVTLAPNEAQVIRVQYSRNAQLNPGEYRSHLYVRALSKPTPLGTKGAEVSSSIEVKLTPVFGITIPVIIRIGESNTTASISGLSLTKTADAASSTLHMTLNRNGNMSIYGDITVKHITPNGQVTQVGLVKGLAVYTPNLLRNIEFVLENNPQVDYHTGKLAVQFITNAGAKDQKTVSAELLLH